VKLLALGPTFSYIVCPTESIFLLVLTYQMTAYLCQALCCCWGDGMIETNPATVLMMYTA
jgi:hypothetical protein